mgnify:CR=1 FL=1
MSKTNKKLDKTILILKAAESLFNQYGYKKVSIDEIVKKANIAKGTFYLDSNDKQDVYIKLIDQYFEKKTKYTQNALNNIKKNNKENFFEAMVGNLVFLIKTPILREIFLQNPNYTSNVINRDFLQKKNMEIIKPMFTLCDLRKDMNIGNNPHKQCEELNLLPMLLASYRNNGSEKFWTCTENLIKIWIDGLTSNYKWTNKPAKSIASNLEKRFKL